jgi:predicted DNA-binding transcriptional regulator AlpA
MTTKWKTEATDSTPSNLAGNGFLRLRDILAPHGPIPVSRSTWWAGCRDGRFPAPVKLSKRVTVWKRRDVESLMADPEQWRRDHD